MPNASGVWSLSQQFQARGAGIWPQVPGAPTITSATGGNASATVNFSAPSCTGYPAITSYTVTSTPGSITATGAASPITVSGLTNGTVYTFKVKATNPAGAGPCSAASSSVTPSVPTGSQSYTTPGTYSWVAPACVTSVSVVAVGGGGYCAYGNFRGGGGGLGYKNNYAVTPGSSYTVGVGAKGTVQFGGDSYFLNTSAATVVRGTGGGPPGYRGTYIGDGGGNGGYSCLGGGGAGGYSGDGGKGGTLPTAGSGGGGGGGGVGGPSCYGCCSYQLRAGAGGGVGLFGQGANGAAGACYNSVVGAVGGDGGAGSGGSGASYGGGSGWSAYGSCGPRGGAGALRIVWPGNTRQFPTTNVGSP